METQALSQIFPLFNTASPDTLNWIIEIATPETYHRDEVILTTDNWGKAAYFIVSGWVKLQYSSTERKITQTIVGRGDFFGEGAILEEYSENMEVVALSEVHLFTISAQRFIQALFQDSKLQHRLLQLMVKRLKILGSYRQLCQQPPVVRLVKILVFLAENYGEFQERGISIVQIPAIDLADITNIDVEETEKIIDNLQNNGWIEIDRDNHCLCLINIKQLINLSGKV
ncbi:MAG: Crp/Fnr family transcriptional regulator [Xenococcaceae cyanobacterium MO_188.B32]|nr:Crp/Fnr family transcriptional regulator [Xenococcaceae cyanobacterium MO_188.B32]